MKMENKHVVGRYAPSPSGRMHFGNAFTAVLAWLYARSAAGTFLLRIEDLDPDRCKPEYALQVRDDLRWLGLDWDSEGIPQSCRTEAYEAFFYELQKSGLIYPCFCSRADLHAANAPHASDGSYVYSGSCRYLSEQQRNAFHRPPAYRIKVPDKTISFRDGLQGFYSENLAADCGDFILRRADGVFSYQLAVCVDDAAMGVNQIVRGCDLLSSAPRQIWLLSMLGAPQPDYFHVPLLCGQDGHRLSKRNLDIDFAYLRNVAGPDKLLGKIGFLSGLLDRYEPISIGELLSVFHPSAVKHDSVIITQEGLSL